MTKLVVFDLDGTLTESKSKVTPEIVQAISDLQKSYEVAIISGCSYKQFEDQFLFEFNPFKHTFMSLRLLPTCGAQMYMYDHGWFQIYNNDLLLREKVKIFEAFECAIFHFNADIKRHKGSGFCEANLIDELDSGKYGEIAEDRGSQITFSMLGQEAPLEEKNKWDPDCAKRKKIAAFVQKYLLEFEVRIGGTTSIDVTKKGIDKSFGVLKIIEHLSLDKQDVLFVGDALFKGGNDYPVKELGIECIPTSGPKETLKIIDDLRNK